MDDEPILPIPISYVGSKYLVFDIKAVTWLRRNHCICGVMGGTLPQAPSQNLFLGLPQQIMPEEAQLLVEKGVGCIVDDARAHEKVLGVEDAARNSAYLSKLQKQGEEVTMARAKEKAEHKRQSLKKVQSKSKNKLKQDQRQADDHSHEQNGTASGSKSVAHAGEVDAGAEEEEEDGGDSLFDSLATIKPDTSNRPRQLLPHNIVPSTSDLFLIKPTDTPSKVESQSLLPNVPSSYPLYRHLNSKSYYMTPGLRFGCQYSVYPGDPLRYHSHFLATAKEWEEEINLIDIVGGGRLGTGVKKAFLIGGQEPSRLQQSEENGREEGRVRTFSIEWAAM